MGTLNKKAAIAILLLFIYFINAQNTFSKKIHYGLHDNLAEHITLYNDTFYIPVMVANHTQPNTNYAVSLLKLDLNGNTLSQTSYSVNNTSISLASQPNLPQLY
jgi:hypothetical protein